MSRARASAASDAPGTPAEPTPGSSRAGDDTTVVSRPRAAKKAAAVGVATPARRRRAGPEPAADAASAIDGSSPPRVGWIGVGRLGLPMAQRVLAAGLPLAVWARRRAAAQPLVAPTGAGAGAALAQWADDPETLAAGCDLVATVVTGPDDVRELHERMLPAARRGTVFVDLTTASPREAETSGVLAAALGMRTLDAPVSGGVAGAERGALTAFVGGDDAALERAQPLLDAFCARVVRCGAAGAGYRTKLVNQTIAAAKLLGVADAARLARAVGLQAPALADALRGATAADPVVDAYLASMMAGDGRVTFTLALLRKDLRLARDECAAHGARTAFLDAAIAAVEQAIARHGGDAGVQMLAVE